MPSASSWETLAKNHIPGRDWASIRNVWAAAALGFPSGLSFDLSQSLEPVIGPDFEARASVKVFSFLGGTVPAFHDAAAALNRSAYVLRVVGNCLLGGQPTWASVDAYHFSLTAGRGILGFLGIHFVQIKDTHCVLDVFPQGTRDQTNRKFNRENGAVNSPARLIFRTRSEVISQREIWTILVRLLNVSELPAEFSADVEKVRELGSGFGKSRNKIIYDNSSWLFDEDAEKTICGINLKDDVHSYSDLSNFFLDERDANFAFARLVARILVGLARDVERQSGASLLSTSYGRCLLKFSGFDIAQLDSIYASEYHRGAYGAEI